MGVRHEKAKGFKKNRLFERTMNNKRISIDQYKTDKEKSEELKRKRIQEIKKGENK